MNLFIGISIAVIIGFLFLAFYRFIRWRKGLFRRLNNGRITETDRGKIEYVCIGEGPTVLLLHGSMGGWDQGILIADGLDLVKHGFTVVSPSRPGYARTPIEVGKTPEAAADAMAVLLDNLNIKTVIVFGFSGGGPTALQFTLRHPNYTQALVMFAAISGQQVQPERTTERFGWLIFSKYSIWLLDMIVWFMTGIARLFPSWTIKLLFNSTANENFRTQEELEHIMKHSKQVASLQKLIQLNSPFSIRKPGLDNDLKTVVHLPVYPLEHITCPTLVVHGRADGNVPFSHAEFVVGTIPNAEMYVVENGGHFLWTGSGADQMQSVIINFLKDNSGK